MNNLKFRAWHKEHGKYYQVEEIRFDKKELVLSHYIFTFESVLDEVIIEQCTGLKDKNGKEIYINDILKVTLENTREIFICLSDYKEFITDSIFSAYYKIEVIGNNHENKELLK